MGSVAMSCDALVSNPQSRVRGLDYINQHLPVRIFPPCIDDREINEGET